MSKSNEQRFLLSLRELSVLIERIKMVMKENGQSFQGMDDADLKETLLYTLEMTTDEWNETLDEKSPEDLKILGDRFHREYPLFLQAQSEEHADYLSVYG